MIQFQNTSMLLAVVGLAVLVAVRLVYRGARPSDDQVHLALRTIGWTLIAMGGLSAVEMVFGLVFGPLFWLAGLLIASILVHRYRFSEQQALLTLLAIAAEKQMPLAPGIEAFAAEWGGQFGQRAMSLAQLLKSGLPLADCLQREPGLASNATLVAVRVGTETGQLGPVLREAVESQSLQQPIWHSLTAKVFYLLSVLFVAQATLVQILVTGMPRMRVLIADFGVDPLPPTQWLIDASDSIPFVQFSVAVLVLQLLLLFYLTLHFVGLATWLPGLGWFTRRLDTATLLRALAWTTQRQQPLAGAVQLLARWYPSRWIRQRLVQVQRDLAQGVDWRESLRSRRLIGATEAAVLAAAGRVGNLPWALREMAGSNERRLAYRIEVVMQWLYPLVIVWMGMLVYVFATASFLPLIQMLETGSQ